MTDRELREKAKKVWGEIHLSGLGIDDDDNTGVSIIAVALKDAYRGGMEAMRDEWIEEEGDRFAPQRAADWLLEGKP